jgi:hypothetical protein
MGLEHISEGYGSSQINRSYLEAKQKLDSKNKDVRDAKPSSSSDHVEISEDAKRLSEKDETVQRTKDALGQLPDNAGTRYDKVREAMVQILTGYYEQRDVIAKVVDALLETSPNAVLSGETGTTGPGSTGQVDPAQVIRLAEVEKKIAEGYYERPDVIEAVATRLLE